MKFQLFKPDGNFIIKDADTVTSEYVEVELDEQTTASAGVGYADLKLTSNGVVIYTCHVSITIDTPVATDETIVSLSMIDGYIFPDDFQLKLSAGDGIYFSGEDNRTINATTIPVVEGEGITIEGNTISVSEEVLSEINGKQNQLTAGSGITITDDTISATVEGLNVFTAEQTSDGYGNIIVDLSNHQDVLPENIVSVVAYMGTYNVSEPLCIGHHVYPINDVVSVIAKFVTAYSLNPCANISIKFRVFYKPITTHLVAEEHRVGEGGNE